MSTMRRALSLALPSLLLFSSVNAAPPAEQSYGYVGYGPAPSLNSSAPATTSILPASTVYTTESTTVTDTTTCSTATAAVSAPSSSAPASAPASSSPYGHLSSPASSAGAASSGASGSGPGPYSNASSTAGAASASSGTAAPSSSGSNSTASQSGSPSGSGPPPLPTGLTLEQCVAVADNVLPDWAGADFNYSGVVRKYYITAEQITWNYAPSGWDNWLGVPLNESVRAFQNGYLSSTGSIGGADGFEWQKGKYVGYTDATFTTKTEQPNWMGLNGPIMRAEVGDMIQIVFQNKLKNNYMDMHSMGMGYDKSNEGSLYPANPGPGPGINSFAYPGDAVPPGGCFTYKWLAGALNTPPPGFDSHIWGYHPYVDMPVDLVVGFAGPTIIYNRGKMAEVMSTKREFILMYQAYPEFVSWLDTANVAAYAPSLLSGLQTAAAAHPPPIPTIPGNASIWGPQLTNSPRLGLTQTQGPIFWTFNGYVMSNTPAFEMCQADQTLWYLYAYGAQSHVFHLHGNNFHVAGEAEGYYRASLSLNNGEMRTLSMNASRPGSWQAICHVSTHIGYGMEQNYNIYPQGACPLTPLQGLKNSTIP